mmetsp:Transcript_27274/g.41248  ORF Transcript_27274/g.41248 Transcript_27274/m.41248 type:complete len:221 (+) Transcript_27274:167-829(+)|eukprot:CAMPEP_0178913696 /NCGR_PEP_ID=MMETSP0786-20121207/10989_1 /TAXON_ID=186022 /ORGANISM="Thalassionema frauenfeldii, Strain CCMP 1798" /LENGTH=220 /DNA_ID=CAMNT_0020586473 /DNA_START=90 /DNA_END=752 /DNA_ORIENTATION=+
MNRIFGKKKAAGPPPPSLQEASNGIGSRVEGMDAKINELEKQLIGYKDKIKKTKSPAAKNSLKKRAMEILKRKKMYEQQRDQAMGQQFNIDQAAFSIDSAKASVATVATLKATNQEMKRTIGKELNIDDVDELADEMAELMDDFNEINEVLGQNFATPDDIDEADLDAELEMLADELEEEADEINAEPSYLQANQMPDTPSGLPAQGQKVDQYGLPAMHS